MMTRGTPARASRPAVGRAAGLERLWWLTPAAVALPLILGLALLARHTWYPVGDYGQNNLRLLSLWSHPPLVGAAGRILGPDGQQGSHPGPTMFWSMWPTWRLFGASSWAVNVAVAVANLAGATLAAVCALRIGGRRVAAAVGAVALLLVSGYGPEAMLMPWNPTLPLMWFPALIVGTWGVLLGHRWMLLVVAGAASHVVQTHASTPPVALTLCGLAGVAAGWDAWRTRSAGGLARLLPWLGGALALTVLLWVPPLVDQATNDPGNLSALRYSFTHPDAPYVGPGRALHLLVLQLDPTGGLMRGAESTAGVPLGGIALLLAWVGTALVARRRLPPRWRALDVVLAVALLAAWVGISRIFGIAFVYLFKWTWTLTGFLLVATGAHVVSALRAQRSRAAEPLVPVAVALALLVGLVAGGTRFAGTEVSSERQSDTITALIEPTTASLEADARHLVRWRDPAALGGVGIGMVLELERQGFDVGVDEAFSAAAEPHRVIDGDEADDVVWVVSGDEAIEETAALPGAEVVARADVRSPAEQRRYATLRGRVADRLETLDLAEQADALRAGGSLFAVLLAEPDLPDEVVADISEMVELFLPTAVIVTPSASA